MNAPSTDLLTRLRGRGIKLTAEGDQLRFSAPAGTMTAELKAEVIRSKPELLRLLRSATPAPGAAITPVSRIDTLPLSHDEQRLWFLHHALADPSTYNVPAAARIRGPLDLSRLHVAFASVMKRHEILRTGYVDRGGVPQRQISDACELPMQVENVRTTDGESITALIQRRLALLAAQPFALGSPPLFRVICLHLGEHDHVLALVAHHIICDAWSVHLLRQEVEAIYSAPDHDAGSALPSLPIQYADYAAWQCRRVATPALDRHREYWRGQLHAAPAGLDLPLDRRRPGQPGDQGAQREFILSHSTADALELLGTAHRATPFIVWLAAFGALLARISGNQDLVIGTPLASRTQPEVQALIGFFLNTLPIRMRIDGTTSFRTLLDQVRGVVLDAFEHGELPLDQIVNLTGATPVQQTAGTSPFSVMFVLHEGVRRDWRLPGTTAETLHPAMASAKVDLTLFFNRLDDDRLRGVFEYRTELFASDAMDRLIGQLIHLVEGLACRPEAVIRELDLLPAPQRRQIVSDFNPSPLAYPRDATVPALFAQCAETTPAATALVMGSEEISYASLNTRANQVAHHLRTLGVGRGDRVALLLERSPEFVVCVLAALKAGAIYVPLDPHSPAERLQFMLEDTAACVLITHGAPPAGLIVRGITPLDLAQTDPEIAQAETGNPKIEAIATDPAYIMFTSGSTGRPKGVVIPHRGIIRLVRNQAYLPFTPDQRFLLLASPAFDASTFELWGPLLNGATCVIFPESWPDFESLEKIIRAQRVTCLWLTAGLFNQIIDQRPGVLTTVSHVITGGEALSVPHVRRALAHLPQVQLTNGYGPTESTTFACTFALPADGSWPGTAVPIGRPISHTRAHILDAHGQLVPIGAAGELYLGGDGLANGYWNRADLTAERFVPDPFFKEAAAQLYRTGDQCRWLPDGTIEFLGRLDHQVKLRGFRIELGEIESVLAQTPGVAQATVVLRETDGQKELHAYLVSHVESKLSVEQVRKSLSLRLPSYMVPTRYAVLDRLPLNANGKIDRQALPAAVHCAHPNADEHVAPDTPEQVMLAAIWERVLNQKRVSIHANFFDVGGTSLLAMRLIHEIRREFNRPLPLADLFAAPTIDRLARRLQEGETRAAAPGTAALRGSGVGTPLFHMPGLGGFGFLPPALVRRIEQERRFFDGLQHRGIDGVEKPLDRIEAIAADLIVQIRRVSATGPYYITGYCYGGLVAYEVARQLTAAGEIVKGVVLWDSFPVRERRRPTVRETFDRLRHRLAGLAPTERVACLRRQAVLWWFMLKRTLKHRLGRHDIPEPAKRPGLSPGARETIIADYRALRAYRPQPYPGRILFLRAERKQLQGFAAGRPPLEGWDGLLPGSVEVVDLACQHLELLQEPALSMAAEKMAEFLREGDR